MAKNAPMKMTRKPSASPKTPRFGFLRKKPTDAAKNPSARPQAVAGRNSATQTMAHPAGRWAFLTGLVVIALLAVWAFARSGTSEVAAQPVEQGMSTSQEQSGAFAANAVGAWLRATNQERTELDQYLPGANITADEAMTYRDLTVASLEESDNGVMTVIVSATVEEPAPEDEDAGTNGAASSEDEPKRDSEEEKETVWTPRWFQLGVTEQDGQLALTGAPAPVQAPAASSPGETAYTERVDNDDLNNSVDQFLNAYLADEGEVDRYTTPNSQIGSVTPAPYESVKVSGLQATEILGDSTPSDGTTAEVMATAALETESGTRGAQYVLTVNVREGRWEIEAIEPAPQMTTSSSTATPQPSATN